MKIRNPSKKEIPYIIEMVSRNLSYNTEEGNVLKDFPLVYQENNLENLWVLDNEGEILSHLATYPSQVKIHGSLLSTLGIGGVVTEEKHRGMGYSSKLITQVLEHNIAKKEATLAILWSDRWSFYEKFQFYPAGVQMRLTCKKIKAKSMDDKFTLKREVDRNSLEQSYHLFSVHEFGNQRTKEEHFTYLQSESLHTFFLWDKNQLLAYAIVDKGKDLKNYIHEWAGEKKNLSILVNQIVIERGNDLEMISPKDLGWVENFNEKNDLKAEIFGLIKILDLSSLSLFVKALSKNQDFSIFNFEDVKRSPNELLNILFGPQEPSLLLPIWYWGTDSI